MILETDVPKSDAKLVIRTEYISLIEMNTDTSEPNIMISFIGGGRLYVTFKDERELAAWAKPILEAMRKENQ